MLATSHPAQPQSFTPTDWAMLAVIVAPIVALAVWGFVSLRRGRDLIRSTLANSGYDIVQMQMRLIRQGPLFWSTTRGQVVYRLVVRERDGHERSGWARWGRRWITQPDKLELFWDA